MPQWAGSSWYFLRYIDPKNTEALASEDKLKYWGQVDWYNGGMEHVTRHLIYSRFWHKFLYDLGVVPNSEPYAKRTAQGLILGPDGEKMSKSKGNVVDPNEVVDQFGADVLRSYVLFMGDYEKAAPWSEASVKGCKRFIDRIWNLQEIVTDGDDYSKELEVSFHKTIKKVSDDIENMKYNTAIASLMALLNEIYEKGAITKGELKTFLTLVNPFAPHVSEELWEIMGFGGMLAVAPWVTYDEAKTVDSTIEVPVQICGKLRATVTIAKDADSATAIAAAKADEKVQEMLDGKQIIKEIYVPGKIINIVAK
jgi:leucyl-tRNA synthetase